MNRPLIAHFEIKVDYLNHGNSKIQLNILGRINKTTHAQKYTTQKETVFTNR